MSSKLGFSGASLHVLGPVAIKRGYKVREQGIYARELGPVACPRVRMLLPNGYVMDRLYGVAPEEFRVRPKRLLGEIMELLEEAVWSRLAPSPRGEEDFRPALVQFMQEHYPDADKRVYTMYPMRPPGYLECYIHGDPTFANVMFTRQGKLRLIDPLVPHGKMPWLQEVDLGKMLQSAFGWELFLLGEYLHPRSRDEALHLLFDSGEPRVKEALFWCGVHAARILPYAKQNQRAHRWAREVMYACWL